MTIDTVALKKEWTPWLDNPATSPSRKTAETVLALIDELEAARADLEHAHHDASITQTNARAIRAAALEEAARMLEAMPNASPEDYIETLDRGHAADMMRTLVTKPDLAQRNGWVRSVEPSTHVCVERATLSEALHLAWATGRREQRSHHTEDFAPMYALLGVQR